MNKILSKVGEGLIVGVMVAIVGSLTGILWNKYNSTTEELNNARELLEKQITGTNEVQAKINDNIKDYMTKSQIFKNEVILEFIEQQAKLNERFEQRLDNLIEVVKSSDDIQPTSPAGEIEVPMLRITKVPTQAELEKEQQLLEQLETFQAEQSVYQQEQVQIQQQIKR